MAFLLDTNVISEVTRATPDQGVMAFLSEPHEFWISVVTMHELAFGIALLPAGRRRDAIAGAVAAFTEAYGDRVIPLATPEAQTAAHLRAQAQSAGRTVSLGDALIAGTAHTHGLAVATQNVSDFQGLAVELHNPWTG